MSIVEEFKKQHLLTYKNATIEIINNNTKSLVENDILSLVKKPPLDSMDTIRTKLITLAKRENLVLDTTKLDDILDNYREQLSKLYHKLIELRVIPLQQKVENFSPIRNNEVIKIQKKDLESINKKIKSQVKKDTTSAVDFYLLPNLNSIYNDISSEQSSKIEKDFEKFMKSKYLKQINDNISIKVLVKDRTLLSGIAEQGERYLFTKSNSHLFDKDIENDLSQ